MEVHERVIESEDIYIFIERLSSSNCRRCSLSRHNNKIVVYRGNPNASIMLIGEAPGLHEDQQGKTFVGPAGILLDKIFASVGINADEDTYLCNICRCRPVAPEGSNKQNYTPRTDQTHNCLPYLHREIELVNPKIIILAGLTAAKNIMGWDSKTRMGHVAGRFFKKELGNKERECFVIYHPAYVLHAQKSGKEKAMAARQIMWDHALVLLDKIEELNIHTTGDIHEMARQRTTGLNIR